jgi:hypothetical protein
MIPIINFFRALAASDLKTPAAAVGIRPTAKTEPAFDQAMLQRRRAGADAVVVLVLTIVAWKLYSSAANAFKGTSTARHISRMVC